MLRPRLCGGLLLGSLLVTAPAGAAVLDPSFTETLFLSGQATTQLTSLAWATDGSNRLFFTRKNGSIRVVENGVLQPVFATVSPISLSPEAGLVSITVDPNFAQNHYVYVFVVVSLTESQIIRYTASSNLGTDKTIIVSGLPTRRANHNGGGLGFGPDGKIYWSIGDNGNFTGVDADLTSLAAKVGRANLDGSAPNDNPFFDGDGPNNDYIWARGFRNPFSLTFQPSTERIWIGVAGNRQEQIFMPQAGDHAGWDNYEANQPAGFIRPVISYGNDHIDTLTIVANGAVRAGGVVTFTTNTNHPFQPGAKLTVSGVADPSFNEVDYVKDVPSRTQFTFQQAGPDATSGGGTAASEAIGGCVTGGTFWDSSEAPPDLRGNYLFPDYNTGRLMRAVLDAQNKVSSVDEWGNGLVNPVKMVVGPDGALYYGGHRGDIFRTSYDHPSQALVVSRLHIRMWEGGSAAFSVRLAEAPAASVAVTVNRSAGDANVTLVQGATLSFNAANWSVPQTVLLAAAQDPDSVDDETEIDVSSPAAPSEGVRVRVTDDDSFSLILSSNAVSFSEGDTAQFQVRLSEPPPGPISVAVARSDGDADIDVASGASLDFTAANWSVPQPVTVAAAEDADSTDDGAVFTVSGPGLAPREVIADVEDNDDMAPSITSSAPTAGVVGAPYWYDVEADGLPVPVFSLDLAPSGMTIAPESGLISWTPSAVGSESVVVRAANGILPDATQAFAISVAADQVPNCELTKPPSGAVLSGVDEEFFGDVSDDVGAVATEFSIDGELTYRDENTDGHYHLGGGHNAFDTTLLTDGAHVLGMTGYDTSGQTCSIEVDVVVDNGAGGEGGASSGGEGGAVGSGGASGGGGGAGPGPASGGTASAGSPADAGSEAGQTGGPEPNPVVVPGSEESGCGCRVPRTPSRAGAWLSLVGLCLLFARKKRSARSAA